MIVRKIRMLFFVREPFPTFRVDVDILFGKELLDRGHEIDFVMQAATAGGAVGRLTWNGRTVWVGSKEDRLGSVFRIIDYALALWHDLKCMKHMQAANYDVVQIKDKFLIAPVIYLIARARGLKVFYWLSFPFPEAQLLRARDSRTKGRHVLYLRGSLSYWLLYKWMLPRFDHVFVQSERMKTDVAKKGIAERQLTVVPMGVPREELSGDMTASIRSLGNGASPLRLVYLGTLAKSRGLEILIDMLSALRDEGVSVKLLMIGDGDLPEDRRIIETYAAKSHVSDMLECTGFLPRADAMRRAKSADIGLSPIVPSPILMAGSPTKLVEYMAIGLPVVANDHPEQRLVLDQSKGGICVPWGSRYFARAVVWLSRCSFEQRHQIGQRGRQWVMKNRSYERIGTALEERYLSLLKDGEEL